MKIWRILVLALVPIGVTAASAQDAVKADPDHYTVILDNPSVRVLKISYAAGATSKAHQHPDSIVIPLTESKVRFTLPDGKSEDSTLANESAMYSPAGTHTPTNVGTKAMEAVLVEFKTAAPGKAALPTSRAGMEAKVLAEGPRATAYRSTASATFAEPVGTTHEFDQVVIPRTWHADVTLNRWQTCQDNLGSGRRPVHRSRSQARSQEHWREAGGHDHRGDQVTPPPVRQ